MHGEYRACTTWIAQPASAHGTASTASTDRRRPSRATAHEVGLRRSCGAVRTVPGFQASRIYGTEAQRGGACRSRSQRGANTHRDLGPTHKRRGGLLEVPVPELCMVDGLFAELVVLRPERDARLHPVHVDAPRATHPFASERWCKRLRCRRSLPDRRHVRPRVLRRQRLRGGWQRAGQQQYQPDRKAPISARRGNEGAPERERRRWTRNTSMGQQVGVCQQPQRRWGLAGPRRKRG